MKTIHVNFIDAGKRIYCYKIDKIVELNPKFFADHCGICNYAYGDAMGRGVECIFNDASNEEIVFFNDSSDSEKWAKWVLVRIGAKEPEGVENRLQGYPEWEKESELVTAKI